MPIPNQAVKVVLVGGLPGNEVWSTSVWIQTNVDLGQVDLQNMLGELNTQFNAGGGFYSALAELNPINVTLTELLGYQYQGGSKAAVQASVPATYTPTARTVDKPNQVCLVASLRTGLPGRARRGRMYVPALACPMGTNGQSNYVGVGDLASHLATSFGAFNAAAFGTIAVCSQSTGAMLPVTQIQVDHVMDTQRRRRDKLIDAAPATAAVATS